MPYSLIKGSFHIHNPQSPRTGPEPDGDTVKFAPLNRDLVLRLPRPNRAAGFNRSGQINLRFEAIDALETHFGVGGETFHQPLALALAARDALLARLGFGEIQYFADKPFKVESVEHHPIQGYVLSNGLDTYGRVIAFAFTGEHPATDGTQVFLTPAMLEASVNTHMLKTGHAWAAFYLGMPAQLREFLRQVTIDARVAGRGLWAAATGLPGKPAQIRGQQDLLDTVIWPKLFRRLLPYFLEGFQDFSALDAWLRADPKNRDDRLLLPDRELSNMHDLIIEEGHRIYLAHYPEDVVIVPDDYILQEPPAIPEPPLVNAGAVRIAAALVNPLQTSEGGHETVTLLNTSANTISLDGWRLADNNGSLMLNGQLGAGETLRVRLTSGLRLSNIRDTLTLVDAGGALIDQVSYQKRDLPPPGHSKIFSAANR